MNKSQYKQSLSILQKEQRENTPSRNQEKLFKLLNIVIYAFILANFVFCLPYVLPYEPKFISSAFFFIASKIAFPLLAMTIVVLLVINIPYLIRVFHQMRLARKLGVWKTLGVSWKKARPHHKLRSSFEVGILAVGYFLAVWDFFNSQAYNLYNILFYALRGIGVEQATTWYLSLLIMLLVGAAMVATAFMRRSKERLGLVSGFYSSLEAGQDEALQYPGGP